MQKQILEFWFGSYLEPNGKLLPELVKKWFASSPEFDDQIRVKFSEYLTLVASDKPACQELQTTPLVPLIFLNLGLPRCDHPS